MIKPMTRKQRMANALPGEERVRRKFDGKYYTLKLTEYSRREAEEVARIWRDGRGGSPQFVRIVPVPAGPPGSRKEYAKYLLYMCPRPLTQKERDAERRARSGPDLAKFFYDAPTTKRGRKAWKAAK